MAALCMCLGLNFSYFFVFPTDIYQVLFHIFHSTEIDTLAIHCALHTLWHATSLVILHSTYLCKKQQLMQTPRFFAVCRCISGGAYGNCCRTKYAQYMCNCYCCSLLGAVICTFARIIFVCIRIAVRLFTFNSCTAFVRVPHNNK